MADTTTPAPMPPAHQSVLKGVIGNALAEHGTAVDAPTRVTAAVAGALAELGYGTLLAELDRVRGELKRYRSAWHNARARAADGYGDAEFAEQSRDRWREATLKAEAERDTALARVAELEAAQAAEVMADELQRMGAMTWLYADGIVREHDEKIGQRELAKRLADALLRRMAAEDGDR